MNMKEILDNVEHVDGIQQDPGKRRSSRTLPGTCATGSSRLIRYPGSCGSWLRSEQLNRENIQTIARTNGTSQTAAER